MKMQEESGMKEFKDTIGSRIAKARKDCGMTQADVAEKLNVTFQAVSLWERDMAVPDTYNLIELAKVLGVSVSSIVEDRDGVSFKTSKKIFDWRHMASFIKHTARAKGYRNTLKALDFAIKAHEGQTRKRSDIPYIYHPLNMACHALAMKVEDDEIIAAILLHDVVEDCGVGLQELPVSEGCRRLVSLMSKDKNDSDKERMLKKYYEDLGKDPRAALIKCIDRCNNLTTMSWGLSRKRIYGYINETEKEILPLLEVVKGDPDLNDCAWLLRYQIESMLDIYKRLM